MGSALEERETAETLEAHAETLAQHTESFISAPRLTIRPTDDPVSGDLEALRWLEELKERGGDEQLRPGTLLGAGGMGVVRAALQESLGREVAVKTLRSEAHTPHQVLRLLREAWITGALEHPNIIPVHALHLDDAGAPQVVLKKIEGRPWSDFLVDDALPEAERDPLGWHLGVLRSVCNALAFAHSRGIVHRDVKPENVMVGAFGEVYLADWGIALAISDAAGPRIPRARENEMLAGTPAYMAPEMARGAPPDERTDVYLLGATLFEVLTGEPPHQGDTFVAMLGKILTKDPERPAGAPQELADLCVRAMALDPADRFQSVGELAEALDDFVAHRDANRLASEAEERLAALLELLAEDEPDPEAVHRAFGACRFGFLSALEIWPESPGAREGLGRVLDAMIEEHLARGDVEAAAPLLAEHPSPSEELSGRVEAGLAARQQERALLEAVRHEQRQMDRRIGRGRRLGFALTLAALFALAAPLGYIRVEILGHVQQPRELLLWPAVGFVVCGGLALLWRRTLLETRVNRRLMGSLVFAMGAAFLFHAGALRYDVPIPVIQTLDIVFFFVCMAGLVAFVERGLWPTALAFLISFGLAMMGSSYRWLSLTFGSWVMIANFMWVWPPWRDPRSDLAESIPPESRGQP